MCSNDRPLARRCQEQLPIQCPATHTGNQKGGQVYSTSSTSPGFQEPSNQDSKGP